ncbi:MAG: hypothetical protein M3253_01450, partial [Chloroflexota bacterium]|nr:hypothetical protein [Chloroflexota bacterium]
MPRTILAVALVTLVAVAGACAGAPPAPPDPTAPATPVADASSSCSGTGMAGATAHPGWPPDSTFELIPTVVSHELAVGQNRVLLNLLDQRGESITSPERAVELRFFNLAADSETPAQAVDAVYLPTTGSLPGLYRAAPVDFACWGEWGLEAVAREPSGAERT